MNSDSSDQNELDSNIDGPEDPNSPDAESSEVQFLGDVQENEPFVADLASSDHSQDAHSQDADSELAEAELVDTEDRSAHGPHRGSPLLAGGVPTEVPTRRPEKHFKPKMPQRPTPVVNELHNMSAVGGSVGAIVLGTWSILCSLVTPFSAINALLALFLGAYGLTSRKRLMALIGIMLGVVGLAMSMIETNEILSNYFEEKAAI